MKKSILWVAPHESYGNSLREQLAERFRGELDFDASYSVCSSIRKINSNFVRGIYLDTLKIPTAPSEDREVNYNGGLVLVRMMLKRRLPALVKTLGKQEADSVIALGAGHIDGLSSGIEKIVRIFRQTFL